MKIKKSQLMWNLNVCCVSKHCINKGYAWCCVVKHFCVTFLFPVFSKDDTSICCSCRNIASICNFHSILFIHLSLLNSVVEMSASSEVVLLTVVKLHISDGFHKSNVAIQNTLLVIACPCNSKFMLVRLTLPSFLPSLQVK